MVRNVAMVTCVPAVAQAERHTIARHCSRRTDLRLVPEPVTEPHTIDGSSMHALVQTLAGWQRSGAPL